MKLIGNIKKSQLYNPKLKGILTVKSTMEVTTKVGSNNNTAISCIFKTRKNRMLRKQFLDNDKKCFFLIILLRIEKIIEGMMIDMLATN